ncbi:MAG: hypothetical protein V1798_06205 [Pseudomonadota bacterium]
MLRTKLDLLKKKKVEVRANGLVYRGVLIEASEDEILLKGETGYITVPMGQVTSVVDPSAPMDKGPPRFVDPSFFTADEEEKKEP